MSNVKNTRTIKVTATDEDGVVLDMVTIKVTPGTARLEVRPYWPDDRADDSQGELIIGEGS